MKDFLKQFSSFVSKYGLDVVGALFNRMRVTPEEMNQFKA